MKKIDFIKKIPVVNPRYISYTYFGVTVVVCSIFLFFFIRPTLAEASRLLKTIEKGEKIDKQLTEKLENLAKSEAIINENKELIPLIDLALPDIVDSPSFVDNVTNVALENNVYISAINIINSDIPSPYNAKVISFNINLSGEYNDIFRFIKSLENSLQTLTAENISINKYENQYSANLALTAYGYTYIPDNIQTEIVPFKGEQR